ncbi:FAD-dependent oxidoreductase, partial [[Eubacterium] siraeum]|nr:FAD-dependent oxidoreductase [[Eubacterium] siraeum]
DKIYLELGADKLVEGVSDPDKIRDIRKKAINANLKLVDCPIRHLGTELAHELYFKIEKYLIESGVEVLFGKNCEDIIIDDGVCKGVIISNARDGGEQETIYG